MAEQLRVLIVDDDEAYSAAMADVVEFAGAQGFVAHTADEAESLLRKVSPDLVVLDLLMPGTHADGLIRRLRTVEGQESVPLLVASGMVSAEDRTAAMDAGANGFILKPFLPKEFRTAIRQLIPLPTTGALPSA